MELFILDLVQRYPMLAGSLSILYIFGMINKPFFLFMHSLTDATETKTDNEILAKIEGSRLYKGVAFVLDWAVRIKLPSKGK